MAVSHTWLEAYHENKNDKLSVLDTQHFHLLLTLECCQTISLYNLNEAHDGKVDSRKHLCDTLILFASVIVTLRALHHIKMHDC